jgi:hypothetical protein
MIFVDADLKEMNEMRSERKEDHEMVRACEKKVNDMFEKTMKTANNLLTLENYCERYIPLTTVRMLDKIFMPL